MVYIKIKSDKLTEGALTHQQIIKLLCLSSSAATSNMVFYDSEHDKVVQFKSVEEYMNVWAPRRIQRYADRKASMVKHLKFQVKLASERAKFVHQASTGIIELSKFKKGRIDQEIHAFGFVPLVEKRWVEYEGDVSALESPFEHLRCLRVETLTPEKVDEYKTRKDKLEIDLTTLERITPSEMWEKDLSKLTVFLTGYETAAKQYVQNRLNGVDCEAAVGVTKKRKKPTTSLLKSSSSSW